MNDIAFASKNTLDGSHFVIIKKDFPIKLWGLLFSIGYFLIFHPVSRPIFLEYIVIESIM